MNEYPTISIITPTFNRNRFIPLMISNLMRLDYDKSKLEWVIDDDGDTEFLFNHEELIKIKKLLYPIKIKYNIFQNKRSIGEKRNSLVKLSTYKIIACMDTDDMYFSIWLKNGIDIMKEGKYSCVGTNEMMFLYPELDFKMTAIRCKEKRQAHESGMGGFQKSSQGEGAKMIDFNNNNVGLLEISKCLMCICHDENTINKDMFFTAEEVHGEIDPRDKNLLINILKLQN